MQGADNAVERLQFLAGTGAAHDDLAACQQVKIKGVGGMAHLLQGVVGGISGVVDGARTERLQALRYVGWRWSDFDTADSAGGVARAALGVFDDDGTGADG